MAMTSPGRALLAGIIMPMAACVSGYSGAPTSPSQCTPDIVPALALAVRDAATQKPIAAGVFVTGLVSGKKGTYTLGQPLGSDSLTIWIGTTSGTYSVQLQKGGYQTVAKSGIVVAAADSLDCHPKTVTVDIDLQPTT